MDIQQMFQALLEQNKQIMENLERINERLDKIEERLNHVEIRLDKIEVKLERIEEEQTAETIYTVQRLEKIFNPAAIEAADKILKQAINK